MMKLPSKDPETIPWMTKREIPAIKAILSAWREMRKDWKANGFTGNMFQFTQAVVEDDADSRRDRRGRPDHREADAPDNQDAAPDDAEAEHGDREGEEGRTMNEKTATRRRKYVSQRVLAASFTYVIGLCLIDKKLSKAENKPTRISPTAAFVIRGLWDSLSDKRRTFIVRDEAFRNIAHLIGEAKR